MKIKNAFYIYGSDWRQCSRSRRPYDVFSACSEIIATSSKQDIRLWYLRTRQELVRITVPNHTCNAIAIMKDGKTIVSGKTSVICSVYVRAQKEDDMYSILDVAN